MGVSDGVTVFVGVGERKWRRVGVGVTVAVPVAVGVKVGLQSGAGVSVAASEGRGREAGRAYAGRSAAGMPCESTIS